MGDPVQIGDINQIVDDDEVQTPPTIINGVQTPPFTASDYLYLEDFIDRGQTHLEDQFQAPTFEFDLNRTNVVEINLNGPDGDEGNQAKDSAWDSQNLSNSHDSDF
ncbi:unnamed protein product [Lactuca saligna]|uniref:Uncharacterized protein n=1 Tax=Lactuca saligna TaxID=75948 RepID=A0AA36DXA5_LACSI|nr:unnamed protein product [Lactuca saligna]